MGQHKLIAIKFSDSSSLLTSQQRKDFTKLIIGNRLLSTPLPFILFSINNSLFNIYFLVPIALLSLLLIAYILWQRVETNKIKSNYLKVKKENTHFLSQIEELRQKLEKKEGEYIDLLEQNALNLKQVEIAKLESNEAKQIAEEADMLKSNFLANMSHEIRTPMNGILGFSQLLQNEDLEKDMQQRYLDIICHNGTMLINLIDDIMDISKIEAGQLALNKAEINLDDLMFDLYTFFNEIKFKQEKEHITIRLLNLNDDENSVFYTDEHRIRQVLTNLIGNSLKFTEKGVVEFGYINNKDEHHIKFYVRDSGIGIPEDKLDMIFDRFRQIEEGSTRKYGGTGIGLFISKHIVELLGGDIWLDSKVGVGSTFYFTLPYSSVLQVDEGTRMFEPTRKEYNWNGKSIIIAEDVETNYRFLKTVLSNTNANIIWARDGEEAVSLCEANTDVDLVLMDIQMPKLNGYEATSQIKRINPQITIIAQTAYAMPNDNIKCIEAGCNDYISKPINSNLLLEKIDNYFSKQKNKA